MEKVPGTAPLGFQNEFFAKLDYGNQQEIREIENTQKQLRDAVFHSDGMEILNFLSSVRWLVYYSQLSVAVSWARVYAMELLKEEDPLVQEKLADHLLNSLEHAAKIKNKVHELLLPIAKN